MTRYIYLFFFSSIIYSCVSEDAVQPGDKLLFIGDSITQDGRYIKELEAELVGSELNLKLVNAGLNSETVSRLSEPVHDPPRPHLFNRLELLLDKEQPEWVFLCYGINDGIYHPYTDENFRSYRDGVQKAIDDISTRGIKLVLVTPPPFAMPQDTLKELLKQNALESYSWANPYPNYDKEVMEPYANYVLSNNDTRVHKVIDIRSALVANLDGAYDSDYIHPNANGHQIIAKEIYNQFFK